MSPSPDSIVTWLSPLDFECTQSEALNKRIDGTSDWILHHPTFVSWLAGQSRSPALWCHGLAGTGKTVGTSIVIDHLRRTVAGPRSAIAFIYCNEETLPAQTALDLLSSLCAQLAAQRASRLPPLLLKLYQQMTSPEGAQRLDIDNVMLVAMALCDDAFDRVFLCIDALDEVVLAGERPILLQKLRWLWNRGVQVFVTSQTHGDLPERCRCNRDIETAMQDCEDLLFEADEEDLALSAWAQLRGHAITGEDILIEAGLFPPEVVDKVLDDCGGMFLMAQLKLDREVREAVTIANENRMRRIAHSSSSSSSALSYPDTGMQIPFRVIEAGDAASNSSQASLHVLEQVQADPEVTRVVGDEDHPDLIPVIRGEDSEVASNSSRNAYDMWWDGLDAIAERQSRLRRDCAMTALSWILHAEEPLNIDDLGVALGKDMMNPTMLRIWINGLEIWVEGLEQDLVPDDVVRVGGEGGWPPANAVSLIDICEGLIHIDSDQRVVTNVPWNLGQVMKSRMFPQAHLRITYALLDAWCKDFDKEGSRFISQKPGKGATEQNTRQYVPLKAYTERHWSAHILACKDEFNDDERIVEFLCKLHESKPTWVEQRRPLMSDPYSVVVTDNETPLLKAARLGLNRVLKILLECCNYPIDAQSYQWETAISAAVLAGHTSSVQLLLKHGASINTRNELGDSLLHMAAQQDDEIMVALILEMGLDKNTPSRGRSAETAIHLAISSKSMNAARMLLKYGCNASKDKGVLVRAVMSGNLELVKLLVEYGFDLNVVDYTNWANPLLFSAINSRSLELVEFMLHNGASVEQLNNRQRSAFHDAAKNNDLNMVKLLFKYCSDPMIPYREYDGEYFENATAVENAMKFENGNEELIELLLARMPPGIPSSVLLGMATGALGYGHRDVAKRLILMTTGPLQQKRKHADSWLIGIAIRTDDDEILDLLLSRKMSPTAAVGADQTPLHVAATHDSPKSAELLIKYGAEVNVPTEQGMFPIHMAAVSDSPKVAALLMKHGATVNALTVANMSPVHIAAHQGAVETLRVLLDYRPDPTIRAADGSTSLVVAGRTQRFEAARLLLEYGVDVSQSNLDGETVLHYAAMDGQVSLVQALLDRGIDPSICSRDGGTALHYAAYMGEAEIVKLLLEYGAEVDQPYEFIGQGFQPPKAYGFRCVTWSQAGPALENPHIRPWIKIDRKWTALHSAACAGYANVVDILLAHGASIAAQGANGESPLHVAASAAKPGVVELMLEKGADVQAVDSKGDTALHWAACAETAGAIKKAADSDKCCCQLHKEKLHAHPDHSKSDCVTTLLKFRSDPTAVNHAEMSPLAVAVAAGQVELVEVLIAYTPSNMFTTTAYVKLLRTLQEKPSAIALERASAAFQETDDSRAAWCDLLANASVAGDLNMVNLALRKGAVPMARMANGENPLHQAIINQDVGIVNALLAAGADIEAVDNQGRNALHLNASNDEDSTITIRHGNRKKEQIATSILKQKGAQVNCRTPTGDTALHLATRTGDDALVTALLRHHASVDIRNSQGRTPLHHAVDSWLFPQIIEMLLRQGANPTATDLQGCTPAHLIRDSHCIVQVIDLLLLHGADTSATTRSGDHPIHSAVRRKNWDVAKCLLNSGASVHDRGARRRTLLHVAARRGHAALVEELMKLGADVEALDADGWTPMRHAKEKERVEVISILSRYT